MSATPKDPTPDVTTTDTVEIADEAVDLDPVGDAGADPVPDTDAAPEPERTDNVRQLLPVHAAPNTGKNGLKVARGPGRPRKVERAATTSDLEYHAEMSAQKADFIEKDPVVTASKGKQDAYELLRMVKVEVAREAAALHFQRVENEKFGKDTSQTSSRRIDALVKIANIELEIKKLGADVIDVRSEKFQKVIAYFIEMVQSTAQDTLPPEQLDLFFNRFSTLMDGWEDKAVDLVR